MLRFILATFHKTSDSVSVAGDFRQKGSRFHDITSLAKVGAAKTLKKNQTQSPVRGL